MEVGNAFVTVAPSAKGFGRSLESQVGGESKSSGGRIGKVFGTAFKVGAAAVVGGALIVGKILKDSFGEAREAQKVGAQTNAVIKSTRGVANVTATSVGRLSTAISKKAGIDDEAIQTGANLLLTFTNIRNEAGKGNKVFDQTVRAATDMSVALGTDAKSAAMQLGKALNDPTKGVTKLMRSGVTFTDQQKKQIATMQKSGNLLGAQKVILHEVNKEFGGSAAAQATAGDKFKVAFGNLEESIGTALLPVLDKVLNAGTKFATFLTNDISPNIAALNGYLAPAIDTLKEFFSGLSGGGQATGFLTTLKNIGSSIATNFLPVIRTIGTMIVTTVLPVLVRFGSYLVTNLFPIFTKVGNIIATQVIPIIATLAKFFYGTLYPAVIKIVTAVAGSLKPVFDELFAQIQKTVLPIVQKLLAKFREWWPTISKVIQIVLVVVGALLRLAAAILGKVLPPLIRFAGFLIRTVFTVIVAVIGVIVKIVAAIIKIGGAIGTAIGWFKRFSDAVDARIRAALGFVKDLPGKAKDALGDLSKTLRHAGEQLIQGLIDGIGAKIGDAVQKVKDGLTKIKHLLPGSPIKAGPLKPWNNTGPTGPGGRLMGLLGAGIENSTAVESALAGRLSARVGVPRVSLADVGGGSAAAGSGAGSKGANYNFYTFDLDSAVRDAQRREAFAGGA